MYKLYRDTFWTLKLADEMFGGIGMDIDIIRNDQGEQCPVCAWGIIDPEYYESYNRVLNVKNSIEIAVPRHGGDFSNDLAVKALIGKGKSKVVMELDFYPIHRVSFKDWCEELGISSEDYIDEDIPGEKYLNSETGKFYNA